MMPITPSMNNIRHYGSETAVDVGCVKPEVLMNRRFILLKINGSVLNTVSGVPAYIVFDENFNFCAKLVNRLCGCATYENGVLTAKGGISTTFLPTSDNEQTFIHVLLEGAKVSMQNDQLILKSGSDELIFKRTLSF